MPDNQMNRPHGSLTDEERLGEIAKDLLMVSTRKLLDGLRRESHRTVKEEAFYEMVVAFHAARGFVEAFRDAHLAEVRGERPPATCESLL